MIDIHSIRAEFPILKRKFYDHPLAYLDTASSAQKPQKVIDAISDFYSYSYANIHRGIYALSTEATEAYESVRKKVQKFINASDFHSIVFTKGATESINLVAQSFGLSKLSAGDEIILSEMEHHSNIVPWQLLKERMGIIIKVIPVDEIGVLDLDAYQSLLTEKVKLVAITHMSNVLGTVNPIKKMVKMAHQFNIPVLVDGCQAVAHMPIDVEDLDCDFYVFSSHKLYGPTGAGVLYGKYDLLKSLQPYQGGGGMIERVSFEKSTTFKPPPQRFEAGTPPIAQVVGLGAAIDFISSIGIDKFWSQEEVLLNYAQKRLADVPGLRIIGLATEKSSVFSFIIKGIHAHDIATFADHHGVAIRGGHHCAQPLMTRYNLSATARASIGIYNNKNDIDQLVEILYKVYDFFKI